MLNKNDFIELEFIGRVKNGNVFDTNIKEEAKKINLDIQPRPFIICLGQNMILPAIDEFLIGKEIGNYTLELTPDKAFGERKREYIRIMPLSVFKKSDTYPQPGMVFTFDNMMGKITSVSGGRVSVDFNNPIAGKEVVYDLRVKRVITEINEKVKSLMFVIFGREMEFTIKDSKIIIEVEKPLVEVMKVFSPKFKEILNMDLEGVAKPEKEKSAEKEIKQEENKEI